MELADEDDDNVCIHSAYQADGRAMLQGIQQVNQYAGVSFLVVTWRHVVVSICADYCDSRCNEDLPAIRPVSGCNLAGEERLFVGSRSKSGQFPGSFFLPATFRRMPLPRFSLVDSLILLVI
jgi:hypothetical protein